MATQGIVTSRIMCCAGRGNEMEKKVFELWAENRGLSLDRVFNDSRYASMETEWAWQAWLFRSRYEGSLDD
jgi:hypothetical protein